MAALEILLLAFALIFLVLLVIQGSKPRTISETDAERLAKYITRIIHKDNDQ